MTTKMRCPVCQDVTEVLLPYAGHKVDCTECGARVMVQMQPSRMLLVPAEGGTAARPLKPGKKAPRKKSSKKSKEDTGMEAVVEGEL